MEHSSESPSPMKALEGFFEEYLHKKAPFHFPENVKEWIVKYGPWINLILLILAAPFILIALGISFFIFPFAAVSSPFHSGIGIVHWIIALGGFILQIVALPGLFRRSLSSWYLVYYGVLLAALGDLLGRDLIGLIIGTAISLYVLFQIKSKYH